VGNDYSINCAIPEDPAQLDGSRLKLRLPPPPRWRAGRPADVANSPRIRGALLGSPAPDAGYVLKLYRSIEPSITGAEGIDRLDLRTAVQTTALVRASTAGRAPVIGDIEWALAFWGFGLDGVFEAVDPPPSEIDTEGRAELFRGCAHDTLKQRRIASLVDTALSTKSFEDGIGSIREPK
jgi:hypothetical protein